MSNPPDPYNRSFNFEDFQSLNPNTPLPAQHLENELNNIEETLDDTISRLNEIQNADGSLKVGNALTQQATQTATTVATSVATQVSSDFLAANFDSNAASSAASSAAAAAASSTSAANSANLASIHANYAGQATTAAQNAHTQAAAARNSAEDFADQANLSKIAAHGSAQSAAASAAAAGNVYNSAISLKNWIDSESFQFLHKREDMADAGGIMLFNGGEAQNTLIGKLFWGASVNADSSIEYLPPLNGVYPGNFGIYSGPWWVNGHESPEDPHKIVMRDMMSCLVDTWNYFGPRANSWNGQPHNLKPFENGINGQPNSSLHYGPERIKGVNYTLENFGVGLLNGSQPLTPKSYVDEADTSLSARIDQKANIVHTHTTSQIVGLDAALDNIKIKEYDNFKTYGTGELILFNNKIYKFNSFVGAAGYGPVTHPSYWTEQSAQPDLTPYLTSANAASTYSPLNRAVPSGGTTGQVLKKTSNTNYAMSWQNDSTGITQTDVNQSISAALQSTNLPNHIIRQHGLGGTGNIYNEIKFETVQSLFNSGWKDYRYGNTSGTSTKSVYAYDGTQQSWQDITVQAGGAAIYHLKTVTFAFGNTGGNWEINDSNVVIYVGDGQSSIQSSIPNQISIFTLDIPNIVIAITSGHSPYILANELVGMVVTLNLNKTHGSEFIFKEGFKSSLYELFDSDVNSGYNSAILWSPSFPKDVIIKRVATWDEHILKMNISGGTFTGKITCRSSNQANFNLGIGGTELTNTTNGDMWITTGGTILNYRDGTGSWRQVLTSSQTNSIDVSSNSLPALRVTQRGTAPSFVVEDTTTPDTSAFVVDTNGNVGIGFQSNYVSTSKLEVVGNAKSTTISTGSGPTISFNSTGAHTGGSDTLDLIVTINGSNYRIGLRPA